MSLESQHDVVFAPSFQAKVVQAMVTAAIAIGSEDPLTTNHLNRANLGRQVLQSPQTYMHAFAEGVASQGIGIGALDAAFQNAVNAIWNAYAGTT